MWYKFLASMAICGVLFNGCGSSNNASDNTALLESYKGEYRNINSVIESEYLSSLFEEVANEKKTYSKDGVRFIFKQALGSSFDSIKVQDSSIEFTQGDKKESLKYKKTDETSMQRYDGKLLFLESEEEPKVFKSVKFLALTSLEGDKSDGFKHFHIQYSSQNLGEKAFAKSRPFFVPKDTDMSKVVAKFLRNKEKISSNFFAKASLQDWTGNWKSLAQYIDKEISPIQDMYADIINKNGGKYDKMQIQEALKKALAENIDFVSCKVIANEKYNKIIYTLADGSTKEVSYRLTGNIPSEHGSWVKFEATEPSGRFQNLLFTVVHGKEQHFHLKQSSKNFDKLAKENSVATALRAEYTDEIFAEELGEFAEYAINQLESK